MENNLATDTQNSIKLKDNAFEAIDRNVQLVQKRKQQIAEDNLAERIDIPWSKRLVDIAISGLALLVLSPLFAIIAIALKLEGGGPVFFLSKRVGTGYKIFGLYKFRSMIVGAENKVNDVSHLNLYAPKAEDVATLCQDCVAKNKICDGTKLVMGDSLVCENLYLDRKRNEAAFLKVANDPRITKIGKFLRNSSLDELPQLINILKGDMSLIGNRPLPLYEAEKLTTDKYSKRFLAPAGLTGLWQVTKRGKKGGMSEEERIELDNYYADNYSLKLDFQILLKTLPALFQSENV